MTEHDTPENCPVTRAAQLIGDVWILLIVYRLMDRCMRFGEIEASLGTISPKTLSQRLKRLEQEEIVTRRAYSEIPPRVEYSLTEKGRALADVIAALRAFGERYP